MLALCVAACSPMVSNRGHVQKDDLLDALQTGTSQAEVQQRYGSPSSTSRFGEETWYYIRSRKEAQGFLRPEITEQQVIGVVFDTNGQVKEVVDYDLSDRQDVVMIDEVTPTEGHSIGFVEQALGNLGRFTGGRERSPNPRGPGRR